MFLTGTLWDCCTTESGTTCFFVRGSKLREKQWPESDVSAIQLLSILKKADSANAQSSAQLYTNRACTLANPSLMKSSTSWPLAPKRSTLKLKSQSSISDEDGGLQCAYMLSPALWGAGLSKVDPMVPEYGPLISASLSTHYSNIVNHQQSSAARNSDPIQIPFKKVRAHTSRTRLK